MKKKKLILFDIDGTLIHAKQSGVTSWKKRLVQAIREVHGIDLDVDFDVHRYNGGVDKGVISAIARDAGVDPDEVHQKFPQTRLAFHRILREQIASGAVGYKPVESAVSFVTFLQNQAHHEYGVMTGNIEINGWLKLEAAGIREHFSFGVFADEVEDRMALARHALEKAIKHYHHTFAPRDVVIIGDTIHDIRCGKHIGAMTIGVTTGITHGYDDLIKEDADLVVDSLMDERVLHLLG